LTERPVASILVLGEQPKVGDMLINDVFRALSDPTRREILRLLRTGDMTAGEIAERFPLSKSTLSGHFNVLKYARLIVSEKRGTTVLYSLNVSALEEATAIVMEHLKVGSQPEPPTEEKDT
jgi:DNA-binding transcriptional ArsR family regulator